MPLAYAMMVMAGVVNRPAERDDGSYAMCSTRNESPEVRDAVTQLVAYLQGLLNKEPGRPLYERYESVLDKVNRYSSAGAQTMAIRGGGASLWGAIGHGLWAFVRTYVIRRGFLDGQLGLALAISNAEGTYYRYAKRWLMLRGDRGQRP